MEKHETVVTSFLRKICSEVTMPNFETSSSYLESGATFHSLRSCKRTRISLREILVCSTLKNPMKKNPLKKYLEKSLSFLQIQFSFGIVCTYNDFLRYNEKRFFNRTSCKTILTFTQCIISPYFFGYFCNLF